MNKKRTDVQGGVHLHMSTHIEIVNVKKMINFHKSQRVKRHHITQCLSSLS